MADARTERLLELKIAAEAAYGEQRWQEAERVYAELLAIDSLDAESWHRHGVVSLRLRRFAPARSAFEQALAIEATRGNAWRNLAIAHIAQAEESLRAAARLETSTPATERAGATARTAAILRELLPPELRP